MRSDRRVDAAGPIKLVASDHLFVERLSHAVQTLELDATDHDRNRGPAICTIEASVCALCVANCENTASGAARSLRAQARYETSVWTFRVKTGKSFIPSTCARLISLSQ